MVILIIYKCVDIDECASGLHNCSSQNKWICKNLMSPEKFSCECNLGFTGDTCEGKEMFSETMEGHVTRLQSNSYAVYTTLARVKSRDWCAQLIFYPNYKLVLISVYSGL